jgi:ribosomal protein S12 methylthiotransferase
MRKTSVYLLTLGCPKNETDSDLVVSRLAGQGFTLVERPEQADVVVVNTCAFIQAATEESIEAILDLAASRAPGAGLYVIGCLYQRYGEELAGLLPEVDGWMGPGEYDRLASLIGARGEGTAAPAGKAPARDRFSGIDRGRAYLKIAEGCDRACSFCTIPTIKGPLRSRSAKEITQEAAAALEAGARELVLVSQDTASYGRDLGRSGALAGLLENLAGLPGDFRVRLMYMQPDGIDPELLQALKHDRICSYLDLPLQHVDEEVLRRMGRRGGAGEYRELIAGLRENVPGIALRSSFITGFPGEDRASFERLRDFVEETRFDWLAVFAFSPEEGTRAAGMPGRCAERTARTRAEGLLALQEEVMRENAEARVGGLERVLVEGPSEVAPGYCEARSSREAPEVDGLIFVPEGQVREVPGFALVELVEAEGIDLIGHVRG